MDNDQKQKELFNRLKTHVEFLEKNILHFKKENSRKISISLNEILEVLEAVQDPEVIMTNVNTQYITVALIKIMNVMTAEEKKGYEIVMVPWLKIMEFLLSKTLVKIHMPHQFTTQMIILFSNFLSQLDIQQLTLKKTSEEFKHLAVKCLSASLPAKYKEGRYPRFEDSIHFRLVHSIRENNFLKIASPIVTALLVIIKDEHMIELRLEALRTLSQILHDNIYNVDLLAQLSPGIVSKLCAIISQKADKENHQVMCSTLDILGELIQAVMRDEINDTLVHINSFEDILTRYHQKEETITDEKKVRDKAWYQKLKQNLFTAMGQILKIRLYPDWRTRLAFVEFVYTLLSKCAHTLDNCIKPLVEIMVLHTDDPYDEVSNKCRLQMGTLLSTDTGKDSIIPILKSELYEWIMKFPQYMISRDESEKTNAISLITGFILLLGDQSSTVLANVLPRASDGWMTALEIDKDSLNILEEKQSEKFIELQTDQTRSTPIYPKIRFKHVVTDVTTAKLTRLLNAVGKYCDLQVWINHFMRYISVDNQESNDPQAAYIIHSLLSGAFALDVDLDLVTDINDWINEGTTTDDSKLRLKSFALYVLKDTMDILTTATSTNKKVSTLTTTSSKLGEESGRILTVCFGLQIVGLTTCILEKDCLQDQLITILYPLLAHLGSSNVYIHTYGLITLNAIALLCGLNNAQELAIQNIDYVINMISQHISILSDYAHVPLVLKALIHVGGYASIGYLDDSVLEIYDALDRYCLDDSLCTQLCGVLFEIIQTLEKNIPKIITPESSLSPPTNNDETISKEIKSFIENKEDIFGYEAEEFKSMENIGKYFLDRQEKGQHEDLTLQQVMEQGNLPMDLPKEEEQEEGDVPKGNDDIPLNREENMTKEIMNKASHLLTASSPQLRSQMLILLTSGVSILAKHPQQVNQLIFSMWPSIVNRLTDPQNYVVLQAAILIERLSEVSTEYLSRKFDNDLWPRFKTLLKKGTSASSSSKVSDYSIFSLYHRTQSCLLNTLTRIAYHVRMNQLIIKDILEETKYYYHNDQVHEQLADACKKLFKALSTQQRDTVWLYQMSIQGFTQVALSPLLDLFVIPEW